MRSHHAPDHSLSAVAIPRWIVQTISDRRLAERMLLGMLFVRLGYRWFWDLGVLQAPSNHGTQTGCFLLTYHSSFGVPFRRHWSNPFGRDKDTRAFLRKNDPQAPGASVHDDEQWEYPVARAASSKPRILDG